MLHFIVNPSSKTGKGKKVWKDLLPIVKRSSIEYDVHMTEARGHGAQIAAQLAKQQNEVDAYVAVGGDGTLNEVLTGLVRARARQPIIGFIPTGSGNDFARNMNLSGIPSDALRDVLHARRMAETDTGLLQVGGQDRPFLVSGGIGYDADVCDLISRSTSKTFFNRLHLSSLAYTWLGLKQAARYQKANGTITYDGGVALDLKNVAFISFHNVRTEGGGWPFAPDARPDDGVLDVCIVTTSSRLKFAAALIASRLGGRHRNHAAVHIIKTRSAHLKLDKKLTVHTDGEVLGSFDELTVTCIPASVRLMTK